MSFITEPFKLFAVTADRKPQTVTKSQLQPRGEVIIRTLAMPADTNPNGDIFGGWIVSQMDIGGSILAKETSQGRAVTEATFTYVAVDDEGNKRAVRPN